MCVQLGKKYKDCECVYLGRWVYCEEAQKGSKDPTHKVPLVCPDPKRRKEEISKVIGKCDPCKEKDRSPEEVQKAKEKAEKKAAKAKVKEEKKAAKKAKKQAAKEEKEREKAYAATFDEVCFHCDLR